VAPTHRIPLSRPPSSFSFVFFSGMPFCCPLLGVSAAPAQDGPRSARFCSHPGSFFPPAQSFNPLPFSTPLPNRMDPSDFYSLAYFVQDGPDGRFAARVFLQVAKTCTTPFSPGLEEWVSWPSPPPAPLRPVFRSPDFGVDPRPNVRTPLVPAVPGETFRSYSFSVSFPPLPPLLPTFRIPVLILIFRRS